MESTGETGICARVARPEEWLVALRFLYGHLPADQRDSQAIELMDQVARGELSLSGLVVAWNKNTEGAESGTLRGVMLSVLQADGTAMLFPPVLSHHPDRSCAELLLERTTDWFRSTEGKLAQCLIEQSDELFSSVLRSGGYPHLAELVFMKRELIDLPENSTSDLFLRGELDFVTYRDATHQEFVRTLGETYIDSQDCPDLSSVRSPEEALSGHRQAGSFHPEHWYLYRYQGENIGLCLLTEHSDSSLWELVYLGLRPTFRGRGFARRMLLYGLYAAQSARMSALTLAVDAANTPALKLYEGLGFHEVLRKDAHLRWKRGM